AAHHLAPARDDDRADVRGRRAVARARPRGGGGRLPDGGRRERGEHVPRPRHRRPHGAHAAASDPRGAHGAARRARVPRGARTAFGGWRLGVRRGALARVVFFFRVSVTPRGLRGPPPQTMVAGGGAGPSPPLVGWAAATGSLDLTAAYLFLIVFYWTPPHFW